jgi:hypothetical protein
VAALRRRLRDAGIHRVGTFDKFQGQEAAVVVYARMLVAPLSYSIPSSRRIHPTSIRHVRRAPGLHPLEVVHEGAHACPAVAPFRTQRTVMPPATRVHYDVKFATIEVIPDEHILSWDNARLRLRP